MVNSCFSVDRIVTKSNKNLNDSSNDRENVPKHIDKSVQTKSQNLVPSVALWNVKTRDNFPYLDGEILNFVLFCQ